MSRIIALLLLSSSLLATWPARAANKLIAVLPLDCRNTEGKMSAAAQASLEEMLRDVATNALSSQGWTVLTGETTLQVLQDNGVDPSKCGNESCHLSMAREIKADKFLSGAVEYVEGEFTASIRLIDTGTGRILASESLEGKGVLKLRKDFESKATAFFTRGGLLAAQPSPPSMPAAEERSAPAPTAQLVDSDGDGVPDRDDKCPTEAGPADFAGCPRVFRFITFDGSSLQLRQQVRFAANSTKLPADAQPVLDEIVLVLRDHPELRLRIEGHTEAGGSSEYNLSVSQRRAEVVRDYFVRAGLDKSRFETIGYGETRPIESNGTAAGRAANRRVEFRVLGGASDR